MTTHIGSRSWTYYDGGQYPCTCFFCECTMETTRPRWRSAQPTSIYACNRCMEEGIDARKYPETGQEVLDTAQTPSNQGNTTPEGVLPVNAREMAIKRAHEENMASAKATRNVLALLTAQIRRLAMAVERSNGGMPVEEGEGNE